MGTPFSQLMSKKVLLYVWTIAAASAVAFSLLLSVGNNFQPDYFSGAALMALVGLISAGLSYSVKKNVIGDMSFIPNLTAIVLYPAWQTVAALAVCELVAKLVSRQRGIKLLFNVAQHVLAMVVATFMFKGLGGEPLGFDNKFNLLAHGMVVVSFMLVNTFCVAAVIALDQKKRILLTWVDANASSLLYDFIAIPFVYGFARAYVDWGAWGAGALLILVVGVRTTYQSKHRLENTNSELLQLFVQTVEFRDPYTSGHSQRVSRSSRIISELLELPKKETERIATAALLHDVGKIHQVFGPILSKTGRLTPEERAVMELHPIKSAELVAKISDLQDLVPAVRGHHERWDGAGYPDQLAGERIPLGARIITIADTIDAMITDRPYRKALGEVEVREELAKHRGTQFDPAICDMLLASPQFSRIFDPSDSGQPLRITGIFPAVRRRIRTPAAA
jgi:HD-GYP domain-containing protein (c-di-GMP phosphodiesterase class II)